MLTSRAAEVFGITDRGRLGRGLAADVTSSIPTRSGARSSAACTTCRPAPSGWSPTRSASTRSSSTASSCARAAATRSKPDGALPGRLLRGGRASPA